MSEPAQVTPIRPDLATKIGAVPIEEYAEYFSILPYGESGVGKTHFIGTCSEHPALSPVLLLDTEGGRQTLRGLRNVEYVRVKRRSDLVKIQNELFKADGGHYKTVAIDSISEVQDVDIREIMHAVKKADSDRDEEVPSPREWGIARWHMRDIVRSFRDLPVHTIFTAHDLYEEKEGKAPKIKPNLPGKLGAEIPGFVSIVGYYRKEGNNRKLQLQGTQKVLAKTRFRELGGLLEDDEINMAHIRDLIPYPPEDPFPTEEGK